MRQQINRYNRFEATVRRKSDVTETNAIGERVTATDDYDPVGQFSCRFEDRTTSFVRAETGETVQRPATVRFTHDVDVTEGDHIVLRGPGITDSLRVVVDGIDRVRDFRRHRVNEVTCTVERI